MVWPFENLKNQLQAGGAGKSWQRHGLHVDGVGVGLPEKGSVVSKLRYIVQHRGGVLGLYRGIGPGTARR